jgi:hypothetical protein
VTNRFLLILLLLAGVVTLKMPADAQVFVSSHTNIKNGLIVPTCQTLIEDSTTSILYPDAAVQCTVHQNGVAIQTLPVCFGNPNAVCTATLGSEIEGGDYQATATHGLVMQGAINGCIQNGVVVSCVSDPLGYGVNPLPPTRQFADSGQVSFTNTQLFWLVPVNGNNDILVATTAETEFRTAQVVPFQLHAKAKDTRLFTLNGNQNANWTFTGTGGTTSPAAPTQGTSITFVAPSTVPVQKVDTLTACKVDTSHGTDCNSAQIIVEVLGVSIPPGNPDVIPPDSNPTELLGGETFQYKATVTQGATTINSPVTWSKVDNSGLNLITIDSSTGQVTVQPQSVFQGGDFFVDIQATSTIDPAVAFSAPFGIHIPTATVQMTTTPALGLNDLPPGPNNPLPTFLATSGRVFAFGATVSGPINPQNRVITSWNQDFIPILPALAAPGNFIGDPNPNANGYKISNSPPSATVSTTIKACIGGHADPNSPTLALTDATCAEYQLLLAPPVFPTSRPPRLNSGESTPFTITGTGFGTAPILAFSDPTVTLTIGSISGPDANGVTTVTGTMTAAPIAVSTSIPLTITSSLPPPSTPVNQNVVVLAVSTIPAVTPANPTLIISQSQQFTPTLGCQTFGGKSCTLPQTSTCSLVSGPGTMSSSCLYTAPASLTAQTQVQAKACFTFGNVCQTFSINLAPVTVAVSPSSVPLAEGQSQQFQASVTNVPNNNQATTWSISPAIGSISATGLYTAPSAVTANQAVVVKACSSIALGNCGTSTVNLLAPDFTLSVSPNALNTGLGFMQNTTVSVTPIAGFTGNVMLTATVPPNGMSASFSPAIISGSGSSVVVFPVTSSTPGGIYTVTITGTSGGLVHSAQVAVTVVIESITVTASGPQTAAPGATVTFSFLVTNNGFFTVGDEINVTGIPPGSTAIPTPITGGSSSTVTVEFTTATTLAPGTYPITLTASSGSLTASATTSLTIPAPPPPPPHNPPPPCGGPRQPPCGLGKIAPQ